MSYDGVGPRLGRCAVMRSVAFLSAGVLLVPVLAGCSDPDPAGKPLAGQDIAPAARSLIADGGTLRWAVDAVPETLNTFQSDADATTTRIAQATLPSMFRLDEAGRPERNPDYLESAKIIETEPKQVVLYKLNQQAVWSDGREIGAADFAAQWRALSGKDSAYWTARNAGYDRIEKIERGDNDLEVRVTFERPYADWRSLFSPLYPKEVMGTPDSFNDGARRKLKVSAGPFAVKKIDRKDDAVRLTRNPRWWGEPAKLNEIVLRAVPRDERAAQLAAGQLDLAEIDPTAARRIALASPPRGATASATGTALMGPERGRGSGTTTKERRTQAAFQGFEVRKSLEPVYTQLALNGADGPLADERVRRAVARALDREELAKLVLAPLGLPTEPVGSHLALSGQAAYADNSGAIGDQDTAEAQALLADAGWVQGGPIK
ncbi:ABC transporter family substrate-binding protein, partial [Streptomyces sp. ISL-14]|nr:ABC transporter family substrate-binding protein [Streptomyces sp. ISL-14]